MVQTRYNVSNIRQCFRHETRLWFRHETMVQTRAVVQTPDDGSNTRQWFRHQTMVQTPDDGSNTRQWFRHQTMVQTRDDGSDTRRWFKHQTMVQTPNDGSGATLVTALISQDTVGRHSGQEVLSQNRKWTLCLPEEDWALLVEESGRGHPGHNTQLTSVRPPPTSLHQVTPACKPDSF